MELSDTKTGYREMHDPDNPDQELIHICPTKAQRILNPIIDWTDDDVWEFIRKYKVRYCELYDQGYKRLGCIACPMGTHQQQELERYPKYRQNYIKAFQRMLDNYNKPAKWKTGEDVMDWWLGKATDTKQTLLEKE